jgi:hypothetical protein
LRLLLCALLTCVGFFGCAADNSGPEFLNVIDVAPREVDVGDRIEVLGTTLPTGEAKEAKVTFKGESSARRGRHHHRKGADLHRQGVDDLHRRAGVPLLRSWGRGRPHDIPR